MYGYNTVMNGLISITDEFDKLVVNALKKKFINSIVHYKANINGDTPNILIFEKNRGVILIDICSFKLYDYHQNDKNTLISKKTKDIRLSPIRKLYNYKVNLFNLHIDGLLEQKIKNKSAFSVVKTVVIFKYETEQSIINFFGSNIIEYTKLLSKDNFLDIPILQENNFFTQKVYDSFLTILRSNFHTKEEGKILTYTKKQKELSVSKSGEYKIRGVAGAGKTYILVKRAVGAHLRHSGNILILTYNKSLKKYIKHKLDEVQEDFDYKYFYIDNYHNFIRTFKNNFSITDDSIFSNIKDKIPKFKSIFIDEIQDYETKWIRNIKLLFLDKEDGEFVVFGDEKQNIYDRELDNKNKINTTIAGRWNELKDSFRFNGIIVDLTNNFQKEFLSKKYETSIIKKQPVLTEENIEYLYFDNYTTIKELAYTIHIKIKNDKLTPKNVAIISSKIKFLQELDFVLRRELQRQTITIFETQEYLYKYGYSKIKIEEIRNFKKNKFDIYSDFIKLSTIQSFKGYESETLFLLITADDDIDEVIYTAFTRATKNLYIVNVGNKKYDKFFEKNIFNKSNIQDKLTNEIEETSVNYDEESIKLKKIIEKLEDKYKLQKEDIIKTSEENIKLRHQIEKALYESNQIGVTIGYTKKIETLLEKQNAHGAGLHQKLDSVESLFDSNLIKKIRFIATMRNKLMHEDGYIIEDFVKFVKTCEAVINKLTMFIL